MGLKPKLAGLIPLHHKSTSDLAEPLLIASEIFVVMRGRESRSSSSSRGYSLSKLQVLAVVLRAARVTQEQLPSEITIEPVDELEHLGHFKVLKSSN